MGMICNVHVDIFRTDALIQNTIKNKFQTCTVITIAHRLNTVMRSDKLLVIEAGEVVEFDHPYNLLKNENGLFYKMVEQTGKDNAEFLHSVADEVYQTLHNYICIYLISLHILLNTFLEL